MRTANPALNKKTFQNLPSVQSLGGEVMTIQGTVNKTALCLFILMGTACWIWQQAFAGASFQGWMLLGAVGGLIVAIITIFKQTAAPMTTPLYSALEGLFLGGISAQFESRFPGIVIQAVSLTFGTLFALLIAYRSRLIPVTQNFRLGIAAATGGIFIVYLFSFILRFFGINMGFIHGSGLFGIGFSLVVVVIAALNLVLDFDFIEHGAEAGAPKYMEWYGAFGLIVTLVWLYLEMLRLLSKLRSR